jgi:coenzyme F420 hydrogenase subunit delta
MLTNLEEQQLDYYKKPTLVLGCGNKLFGDDGFGPEVARHLLKNYNIPEDVTILDIGIGARSILFGITLGETNVKRIIVVDAIDLSHLGWVPGDVFEISLEELPTIKTDDFSMHQVPSSNLLRELRDIACVEVRILVCQIESIPEEVGPGLSRSVQTAVSKMSEFIFSKIFKTDSVNVHLKQESNELLT